MVPTQACGRRVEGTDIGAGEESALLGQGVHGHGAERTTAHDMDVLRRERTGTELAPTAGADIADVDVGDGKVEGWGSEK